MLPDVSPPGALLRRWIARAARVSSVRGRLRGAAPNPQGAGEPANLGREDRLRVAIGPPRAAGFLLDVARDVARGTSHSRRLSGL